MAGKSFFNLEAKLARLPFILTAIALLVLQQLLAHMLLGSYWFSPTAFANSWLTPLHDGWFGLFGVGESGQNLAAAMVIGLILLSEWTLATIAFRRAATVSAPAMIAPMIVIPYLQVISAIWLAASPQKPTVSAQSSSAGLVWRSSTIGMLAGAGIGVVAVTFFTLVLGTYGIGLFVGVPFFMGFTAAYVANRDGGEAVPTMRAAMGSLLLAALALIGFAIEGAVCLIMASPIIAVMGLLGAMAGERWAARRRNHHATMLSIGILPLLLGFEALSPPQMVFADAQSIEIAASPAQVWDSIVHMGPIPAAPEAPFGWGLAYPMRGRITGSGVGAVREGVFSTGVAYERVTEWEPGRKLSFIVMSDPPMMSELSPYSLVRAPHTIGYFKTRDARFFIEPLSNGHTRLVLATTHELAIGPTTYWRPFVEWAIHANKRRVLGHFRDQAEKTH